MPDNKVLRTPVSLGCELPSRASRRKFGTEISSNLSNIPASQKSGVKKVKVRRGNTPKICKKHGKQKRDSYQPSKTKKNVVSFLPGPVGLQLEPVEQPGDRKYGARVVRFVDGGPRNPGQARRSGSIKPGDLVTEAETARAVGRTYEEIIQILKRSHATRELTIQSVWGESFFRGQSCESKANPHIPDTRRGIDAENIERKQNQGRATEPTPREKSTAIAPAILKDDTGMPTQKLHRTLIMPLKIKEHSGNSSGNSDEISGGGPIIVDLPDTTIVDKISGITHGADNTHDIQLVSKEANNGDRKFNGQMLRDIDVNSSDLNGFGNVLEPVSSPSPRAYTSRFAVTTPEASSPTDGDILNTSTKSQILLTQESSLLSPSSVKGLSSKGTTNDIQPRMLSYVLGTVCKHVVPAVANSYAVGASLSRKIAPAVKCKSNVEGAENMAEEFSMSSSKEYERASRSKRKLLQELSHAKTVLDVRGATKEEMHRSMSQLLRENAVLRHDFEKRLELARKEHTNNEQGLKVLYSSMVEQREIRIRELEQSNLELKKDLSKAHGRYVDDIEKEIRAFRLISTASEDVVNFDEIGDLQARLRKAEKALYSKSEELDILRKQLQTSTSEMNSEMLELQQEHARAQEDAMRLRMELEMSETNGEKAKKDQSQLAMRLAKDLEESRKERHLTEVELADSRLEFDLLKSSSNVSIQNLKRDIEEKASEISQFALNVNNLEAEKDKLASELEQHTLESINLRLAITNLERELQCKEEQIREARNDAAVAHEKLLDQIESQEAAVRAVEVNSVEVEEHLHRLTTGNEDELEVKNRLNVALSCLYSAIREKSALETTIISLEKKIAILETEKIESSRDLKVAREAANARDSKCVKHNRNLLDQTASLKEVELSYQARSKSTENSKNELASRDDEIKGLIASQEMMTSKLHPQSHELVILQQEINSLKHSNLEKLEEIKDLNHLHEETCKMNGRKAKEAEERYLELNRLLNAKINSLMDEVECLHDEYSLLDDAHNSLSSLNNKLQFQMCAKTAESEEFSKKAAQLSIENEELLQKLAKSSDSIVSLESCNESMKREQDKAMHKIQKAIVAVKGRNPHSVESNDHAGQIVFSNKSNSCQQSGWTFNSALDEAAALLLSQQQQLGCLTERNQTSSQENSESLGSKTTEQNHLRNEIESLQLQIRENDKVKRRYVHAFDNVLDHTVCQFNNVEQVLRNSSSFILHSKDQIARLREKEKLGDQKIKKLGADLAASNIQNVLLEGDLKKAKSSFDEKTAHIAKLEGELERNESELDDLRKTSDQRLADADMKIKKKTEELSKMADDARELGEALRLSDLQLEEKKEETSRLHRVDLERDEMFRHQETKLQELVQKLSKADALFVSTCKMALVCEIERDSLSSEVAKLSSRLTALKEQKERLEQSLRTANESVSVLLVDQKQACADIEMLERRNKKLEEENKGFSVLKLEFRELSEKIDVLEMMNDSLVQENLSLTDIVQNEDAKFSTMQTKREEYVQDLESKVAEIESRLASERTACTSLKKQLEALSSSSQVGHEKTMHAVEVLARSYKRSSDQVRKSRDTLHLYKSTMEKNLFGANAVIVSLHARLRERDSKDRVEASQNKQVEEDRERLILRTAQLTMSLSGARTEIISLKSRLDKQESLKVSCEKKTIKLQNEGSIRGDQALRSTGQSAPLPLPFSQFKQESNGIFLDELSGKSEMGHFDYHGIIFGMCVEIAFLREALQGCSEQCCVDWKQRYETSETNSRYINNTGHTLHDCTYSNASTCIFSACNPEGKKYSTCHMKGEAEATTSFSQLQDSFIEDYYAGARLVHKVFERQCEMQKANAFRKWSSFTAAITSKANQKVTSQALSLELNATKKKLVVLKSHFHKEKYPGKVGGKRNPRLRSILMPKRDRLLDESLAIMNQRKLT